VCDHIVSFKYLQSHNHNHIIDSFSYIYIFEKKNKFFETIIINYKVSIRINFGEGCFA